MATVAVNIAEVANNIIKHLAAYKMPKDPASLKAMATIADELYDTVQERYALNKAVDALQAKEAMLREHMIENINKESTGVAGQRARASIKMKQVVSVSDWPLFYDFILKSVKKDAGAWSFLQKRPGESAIKEVWGKSKQVPGVAPLDVPTVSLNKVS